MDHKFLVRYLVFVSVLIVCAGAVWYFSHTPSSPGQDAVLAYRMGTGLKQGAF